MRLYLLPCHRMCGSSTSKYTRIPILLRFPTLRIGRRTSHTKKCISAGVPSSVRTATMRSPYCEIFSPPAPTMFCLSVGIRPSPKSGGQTCVNAPESMSNSTYESSYPYAHNVLSWPSYVSTLVSAEVKYCKAYCQSPHYSSPWWCHSPSLKCHLKILATIAIHMSPLPWLSAGLS